MRDWINLVEMPINVSLIGDKTDGSFRDDDITLATNDKARAKTARIWHTSKIDVDLYLLNENAGRFGWTDNSRGDHLTQAIWDAAIIPKKQLSKLHIVPRPEAITLLLTQNEGDQRMPLTGWIIAHRLYHAIYEAGSKIKNSWDPKQARTYPQIINRLPRSPTFVDHAFRLAAEAGGFVRSDIQRIGTTRAGREAKLANLGELVPEAFAQYVLGGKVVFKPMYSPDADPQKLEKLNHYIAEMQGVMMAEFDALIKFAKGKAFRL